MAQPSVNSELSARTINICDVFITIPISNFYVFFVESKRPLEVFQRFWKVVQTIAKVTFSKYFNVYSRLRKC